jgi:hypothetical protein
MKKHILFNGQLECRFAGFDLYDGSKKAAKQGQGDPETSSESKELSE